MIFVSTKVFVTLPELIILAPRIACLWLRYITQNSSCCKSPIFGCIYTKISLLELMLLFIRTSATFLRFPSSNIACRVIAFTCPMPLIFLKSLMVNFPNSLRLLLAEANTFFAKSTADSFFVPLPMMIASNSVSVSAEQPFWSIFSRGRSSSAQCLMVFFMLRLIKRAVALSVKTKNCTNAVLC